MIIVIHQADGCAHAYILNCGSSGHISSRAGGTSLSRISLCHTYWICMILVYINCAEHARVP